MTKEVALLKNQLLTCFWNMSRRMLSKSTDNLRLRRVKILCGAHVLYRHGELYLRMKMLSSFFPALHVALRTRFFS